MFLFDPEYGQLNSVSFVETRLFALAAAFVVWKGYLSLIAEVKSGVEHDSRWL